MKRTYTVTANRKRLGTIEATTAQRALVLASQRTGLPARALRITVARDNPKKRSGRMFYVYAQVKPDVSGNHEPFLVASGIYRSRTSALADAKRTYREQYNAQYLKDLDWRVLEYRIRNPKRNGIVEAAAGLQALEYIGKKAKTMRVPSAKPLRNPSAHYFRFYVSPAPTIRGWYVKKVIVDVDSGKETDGGIVAKFSTKREAKAEALRLNDDMRRRGLYKSLNPSPVNEWDDEEFTDEELNEASRQGWLGAQAMVREHKRRAAGPKFFNVTWYSKQRGKRTGFMRPIEAVNQREAIKQAKAMIENEKTVSNFVAKPLAHNPDNGYYLYAQVPPDKKFSKFWYASLEDAKKFAASVIKDGGKTFITPVKKKPKANPPRNRIGRNYPAVLEQLEREGVNFDADYQELSSYEQGLVASAAKRAGYRAPKSASGSTGRYFYALLQRTKRKSNPKSTGVRIVFNKLLGGWYIVTGPHQTPISGRFDSKQEAQAWLDGRGKGKRNPEVKSGSVVLLKSFWGHKAGTRGSIVKRGNEYQLILKGSQPATVYASDVNVLFRYTAKSNPSTREISERFNGHASGSVVELKAANGAPGNLSRAGKLVFLKLADRRTQLRIPGAVVCIDPRNERLWLAGNRTPLLNRKAKPGERLDFGEVDTICYETAKSHIENGRLTEYVHTFGEDGGRKPHLHVDAEGMPLLVGGDYKIRREGIVD